MRGILLEVANQEAVHGRAKQIVLDLFPFSAENRPLSATRS